MPMQKIFCVGSANRTLLCTWTLFPILIACVPSMLQQETAVRRQTQLWLSAKPIHKYRQSLCELQHVGVPPLRKIRAVHGVRPEHGILSDQRCLQLRHEYYRLHLHSEPDWHHHPTKSLAASLWNLHTRQCQCEYHRCLQKPHRRLNYLQPLHDYLRIHTAET